MRPPLPREDLDLIISLTSPFWTRYRGARLFITGATGFIGSWLLETVLRANETLHADIEIVALSRHPEQAMARAPRIFGAQAVTLVVGDVTSFETNLGAIDLCIHAAADAADVTGAGGELRIFDVALAGTRRVLDLAVASGVSRVLLVSSGAVYGKQPPTLARLPEDYVGAPDTLAADSAYAQGKRAAEWLACAHSRESSTSLSIARVFALVGPNMPLNGPFAAGNFIRDALDGKAITVLGDGRAIRSYLYTADACVWLLNILMSGASRQAYNVGSEQELSITELARWVVGVAGVNLAINIAKVPDAASPAPRYVPATTKARGELGLAEYTPLDAALRKSIHWNRSEAGHEKI
jgi:nucleoside-diphosphate-sugar epimerase